MNLQVVFSVLYIIFGYYPSNWNILFFDRHRNEIPKSEKVGINKYKLFIVMVSIILSINTSIQLEMSELDSTNPTDVQIEIKRLSEVQNFPK